MRAATKPAATECLSIWPGESRVQAESAGLVRVVKEDWTHDLPMHPVLQGGQGCQIPFVGQPPSAPPSPPSSLAAGSYVRLLDEDSFPPAGATRALDESGDEQKISGFGSGVRKAAQCAREMGREAEKFSSKLNGYGFKMAAGCVGFAGQGLGRIGATGLGDSLQEAGSGVADDTDDGDEDDGKPKGLEQVRRKFRKDAVQRLLSLERLRHGQDGPLTMGFDLPNSARTRLTALDPRYIDPYTSADGKLSHVLDQINFTSDKVLEKASKRLEAGMLRSRLLTDAATVRRDTVASDIVERASSRLEEMLASKRIMYPNNRLRKNVSTPPPPPLTFWESMYHGMHKSLTSVIPLTAKCLPEPRSVAPAPPEVEPKFLIEGGHGSTAQGQAAASSGSPNALERFGDAVETLGKKLQDAGARKAGAALAKAGAGVERLAGGQSGSLGAAEPLIKA